MLNSFSPVRAGDLRRHPNGHTLRVRKIVGSVMPDVWAECDPDPPVRGRRATKIFIAIFSKFPLVEPNP